MSPYNTSAPTSMTTNTRVGLNWVYEFDKSWVVDDEGETMTYSCSVTPNNGWMT